jgi:hypothetical protein
MSKNNPLTDGTVWILGAGFSRGLGAPLFRELFMSGKRIEASGLSIVNANDVLVIYRRYNADSPEVLWRDPEEFIDVLESARRPGRAMALLARAVPNTPADRLVDAARRILAIECSQFLGGADARTERWDPYLAWGSRLGKGDTVVSFNYDRVLEVLQENHQAECDDYKVVVPTGAAEEVASAVRRVREDDCAPVLKLHGSVDWVAERGGIGTSTSLNLPERVTSGSDIVLAVPGPDKGEIGKHFPGIGALWDQAPSAVRRARRIVFLGYRFPVTDARARVRFLKAIGKAIEGGTLETIETVLGPDEKHPDVARMKGLLSFVCAGARVEPQVLPLYVEDFLPFAHGA